MSKVKPTTESRDEHKPVRDNGEAGGVGVAEDEEDDAASDTYIPVPPDGGYGWVIMFASFITNVLVDGVCFCVGIFILEFLNEFGESKAKTSWVGSVLNGMYLSMGPITSAFATRFGCRKVTIVGSIIACVGFVSSIFASNVNVIIFTFGGIGGMGFGLMYLPAIVMVGYYFEKKRAFATGIAVCGSGIGAFIFAPMCENLIRMYGWKGACVIIGGLTLNGVVCGALFRPLESRPARKQKIKQKEEMKSIVESTEDLRPTKQPAVQQHVTSGPAQPRDVIKYRMMSNLMKNVSESEADRTITSLYNINSMSANPKLENSMCTKSMDDLYLQHRKLQVTERKIKAAENPMSRKDILYTGSIERLAEYKEKNDRTEYRKSVTSLNTKDDCNEYEDASQSCACARACESAIEVCSNMIDLSLLKNPVFAIYGLSCFLCMTGFFVPFIFLPDYAVSQGISLKEAAFLLSIIGIVNTVARVVTGWVSDRSWADCLLINNFALVIGGVATMFCTYFSAYALLAVYSTVFGCSIAVFVSLRSILMVELIGLEKLTKSFGLVTMCQGLSSFIGAPIAGSIYDSTGDYAISFYVAGGCMTLAGLICFPMRRVARWQARREQEQQAGNPELGSLYVSSNGGTIGEDVIVSNEKVPHTNGNSKKL